MLNNKLITLETGTVEVAYQNQYVLRQRVSSVDGTLTTNTTFCEGTGPLSQRSRVRVRVRVSLPLTPTI